MEIKEQKQHAKQNLIKRLEILQTKIKNLYVNETEKGKPILYPITQEIIELYKTIDKTINKLNNELQKERN